VKKALVFGGTGQMGSYLIEFLKGKNYDVVSFGSHNCNFRNDIDLRLIQGILEKEKPDEIYNFASMTHAEDSWWNSTAYLLVNGVAVQLLLSSIAFYCPKKVKFFNAGSADMYDKATVQQYEDTVKKPNSPHALSKLLAYEAVRLYRDQKDLFAVTGIFFNAESPRRTKSFFANKIVSEAVRLKKECGKITTPIKLGRLDARRDWGWAPEYVEVAWQMLQQEKPFDLVIGTGETHSCKEFVEEALRAAGLPDVEKRFDEYVKYEKIEDYRRGDTMSARPLLAKNTLGWEAKYKMKDVIRMLVEAEVQCGESLVVGQS
jgi:GDPmannose 4,6-dehydratase